MSSRSPAAVSSGLPLVHRFALLVGVFIAALAVLALWGGKTLQEVRVNGPLYERVVQGKDLVADILPPPVYILESYLVAMQAGTATSKEEIERFSGRLDALQKEYATRHDYWKSRHLEAELHTALLERAHAPVNRFFELARSDYLPALIAGRRDDARKALDAMGVAYTEHRSAIDKAVELANKRNEIAEQAAAQTIASNLGVMALLFAATLAASVVLALLTTRKVLRDLGGEPGEAAAVARAVAQGDLGTEIKVKAGDTVSIMAALRAMQDELKRFVGAQTEMARQHEVGEIDHAMPSESFSGVYHDMAASVNALAKSHIALSMRVVDVVAAYARGDLAARMEDLPGKKARVSAAMNAVRESLKSINGEIQTLVDAASRGEFGVRGDETKYEHDFRRMICALNRLMAVSEAGLKDVARVLGAMARGDLTQRIAAHYEGTFDQLKNDTHRTAESLARIVASIRETTESITTASKEIAQGNAELSSRTEEQASSLEETASSMEELTSTVKQNAENAQQANRLAVGASEVAVKGGAVVDQVVATVGSINESSRRIVDIIAVIDGIAFQTNILALNAAVEAARAGEQGRGFAVVATEVRNLAQRSAAAAKEIKALISDSVDKVGVGSKLVAQAGETMAQVVESIKRVSDIVAEITVASQEQSAGIVQINEAINRMDEGTQQNAALVEQAAAAAESLQEQASGLSAAVAKFQLDADAGVPVPVRDVASFASGVETTTRANTGRSSDRMRAEAVLNTVEMHSEPMLTGTDGAGFYRACRNS